LFHEELNLRAIIASIFDFFSAMCIKLLSKSAIWFLIKRALRCFL